MGEKESKEKEEEKPEKLDVSQYKIKRKPMLKAEQATEEVLKTIEQATEEVHETIERKKKAKL